MSVGGIDVAGAGDDAGTGIRSTAREETGAQRTKTGYGSTTSNIGSVEQEKQRILGHHGTIMASHLKR